MNKNNKYKYRFKTEKELINEFGKRWYDLCNWNDEGHMDYLFGTSVKIPNNALDDMGDIKNVFTVQNECPGYNINRTWIISKKLIIKSVNVSNYKPKKFIY